MPYKLLLLIVCQNAELKFNFGGENFRHTPKSGFVALDQAPEVHTAKSSQTGVWVFVNNNYKESSLDLLYMKSALR